MNVAGCNTPSYLLSDTSYLYSAIQLDDTLLLCTERGGCHRMEIHRLLGKNILTASPNHFHEHHEISVHHAQSLPIHMQCR